VNFGGDLIDARFPLDYPSQPVANNPLKLRRPSDYEMYTASSHKGYCKFLRSFSNVIRQLSFEKGNIQWILVPHIYRDLEVSYHLLHETSFPYCRREMVVAPYINGFQGKDYIVDVYRRCCMSIGMRFHANVCPIGLGTPSLGLGTFPMIENLYNALNIDDQYLQAGAGATFEEKLYQKISNTLQRQSDIRNHYQKIKDSLRKVNTQFYRKIEALL